MKLRERLVKLRDEHRAKRMELDEQERRIYLESNCAYLVQELEKAAKNLSCEFVYKKEYPFATDEIKFMRNFFEDLKLTTKVVSRGAGCDDYYVVVFSW